MEFQEIMDAVLRLPPTQQAHLVEVIVNTMVNDLAGDDSRHGLEITWTDDEIAALLQTQSPMTGAEIVAAGLLGTWADLGIQDGAAWVEEQRQKRQERSAW